MPKCFRKSKYIIVGAIKNIIKCMFLTGFVGTILREGKFNNMKLCNILQFNLFCAKDITDMCPWNQKYMYLIFANENENEIH